MKWKEMSEEKTSDEWTVNFVLSIFLFKSGVIVLSSVGYCNTQRGRIILLTHCSKCLLKINIKHHVVPLSLCSRNFSLSCHIINSCLIVPPWHKTSLVILPVDSWWVVWVLSTSLSGIILLAQLNKCTVFNAIFVLIDISQSRGIIEFSKFQQLCHKSLTVGVFYSYRALSSGILVLSDSHFKRNYIVPPILKIPL